MKLRNKKTREIVEVCKINPEPFEATDFSCSSLVELNEEWEDYEDSKDFYYIQPDGFIHWVQCNVSDYERKKFQAIGNYFETKEEAEKAVEKLKALKRLKDKGFMTTYWGYCRLDDVADITIYATVKNDKIHKDLEILFGGEE